MFAKKRDIEIISALLNSKRPQKKGWFFLEKGHYLNLVCNYLFSKIMIVSLAPELKVEVNMV